MNNYQTNNNSNKGIGFLGLLTIVFIVLKLIGVISWNWWWVLIPVLGPLMLGIAGLLIWLLVVLLIEAFKSKKITVLIIALLATFTLAGCEPAAEKVSDNLSVAADNFEIGNGTYVKHFLGISDNVSYMVLQVDAVNVSAYHYRVILRPQTLIPSIEVDVE